MSANRSFHVNGNVAFICKVHWNFVLNLKIVFETEQQNHLDLPQTAALDLTD